MSNLSNINPVTLLRFFVACPGHRGFVETGGRCLKLAPSDGLDYFALDDICKQDGGHLADIHSLAELNHMASMLDSVGMYQRLCEQDSRLFFPSLIILSLNGCSQCCSVTRRELQY